MNGTIEQTDNRWTVSYVPFWKGRFFQDDYLITPNFKSDIISITENDMKKFLKTRQDELKNSIIKDLFERLHNIRDNFDDITYRQVNWVDFKENIDPLWSLAIDDNSKNIVLLLIDGVKNLKAEKMNKSNLDGFQEVLHILLSEDTIKFDMFQIAKILINHQIPSLRFPKGTSKLLE